MFDSKSEGVSNWQTRKFHGDDYAACNLSHYAIGISDIKTFVENVEKWSNLP